MAEQVYIRLINRLSRQRVLLHILFWLGVLYFFNLVFQEDPNPMSRLLTSLGFLPGYLIFVYSLNYFLFPRYVLRGKLLPAIIGLLVILTIALFYMRVADVYIVHYTNHRRLWYPPNFPRSIYALFSISWIAVTVKLVRQWYQTKERQQQLEKEKLLVEHQLLKSQLHPHFLFNTLNSLYAFSMEKSDLAPQIVLKLSSLLRYMLYDCNTSFIPLSTEIDIIRNYLHLASMRFGERLDCSLQFTGDIQDKTVAPLLLLPFVENSIKHGTSQQLERSWLSLNLHVEDDTLSFQLINSRDSHAPAQDIPGGLGLRNVKKRLELLYPDAHTLRCTADEDTWQVTLHIQFDPVKRIPTAAAAMQPIQTPLTYAPEMSHR